MTTMRRLALAAVIALMPSPAAAQGALTLYTGPFSENHWEDFFLQPLSIDYRNAWLGVAAASWRVARPGPRWSLEVEGQVGRWVGEQSNWEINALVAARYRLTTAAAPLRSSVAFGLGPSWASREPVLEKTLNGDDESARWLVYWYLEMAAAPRSWGPWSAVLRLHHRSGAYGWVAEEGGSNVPTLGVRRRF